MTTVIGVDFTSSPQRKKPIQCAVGMLFESDLTIESITEIHTLDDFESILRTDYRVAAVDFPLGQPRRLIEALGWPLRWESYVNEIGSLTKDEFSQTLLEYCAKQPAGAKHHFRETDRIAKACSPMMLYGVPVAKMFFKGAPCVLRSGATVLPFQAASATSRNIIEGYPALVARRLIGKHPYKRIGKEYEETCRENRRRMVAACVHGELKLDYGVNVIVGERLMTAMIAERSGDKLDAVFCAVQAAYAVLDPLGRFRIPEKADNLEGWIVDPWTC